MVIVEDAAHNIEGGVVQQPTEQQESPSSSEHIWMLWNVQACSFQSSSRPRISAGATVAAYLFFSAAGRFLFEWLQMPQPPWWDTTLSWPDLSTRPPAKQKSKLSVLVRRAKRQEKKASFKGLQGFPAGKHDILSHWHLKTSSPSEMKEKKKHLTE